MKGFFKKTLSMVLCFVMVFTMFQGSMLSASAKVVGPDNKTELTITADKSKYSWGDTIVFNIDVKNVTDEVLTGIKINSFARAYTKVAQQGDLPVIARLAPGESQTVQIEYYTTRLVGFMAIFFPIVWLFSPMARIAYREANFNYEQKVKIGVLKYRIGFEVEYDVEQTSTSNILLTIDQDDFETKELECRISGTVRSDEGIESVTYELYSNVDSGNISTKGYTILDGDQWYFDLQLKPGSNVVKVIGTTVSGGVAQDSVSVFYNMGNISVGTESEYVNDQGVSYRKGVLGIYFKDNVSEENIASFISANGGTIIGENYYLNFYQARFNIASYNDLQAKASQLEQSNIVIAVTVSELTDASISINDPWNGDVSNTDWNDADADGSNWGLEAIDIKSAWDYDNRLKEQPARIGVVDSGINLNHPEFNNSNDNVAVSLINGNGYNSNLSDHGSHVSGIIAASPNNRTGITGVAWNTDLYFGSSGISENGLDGDLCLDMLTKAVICGAKSINFSVGRFSKNRSLDTAAKSTVVMMTKLLSDGFDFLFVQAAGNEDGEDAKYNGWFCALYAGMDISYASSRYTAQDLIDHTIIVASADNDNRENGYAISDFSCVGNRVDIAAPGRDIYSCGRNGTRYMSGTSMAAPHVTAVAGLVWSANNELSMKEVKKIVCGSEYTSKAYDYSKSKSYKMLNAGLAVKRAFDLADALGTAEGRFVDATTAASVSSGTFKIHKGTATGEVYGGLHTFTNGVFSFTAPGGRYVLEINGENGYVTRYLTVVIVPFETVNCGDVPLSKELASNQLRIVLSWGQYPRDLDSHIVGQTISNSSFHVAFYDSSYSENGDSIVWLDVDDISSYGPETITIVDMAKVKSFKYLVHNYSDRNDGSDDDGAFNLSDSGARVDVYRDTALIASYNVPVNRKGTVWEVFSMDGNGQITNINAVSYEAIPENVGS